MSAGKGDTPRPLSVSRDAFATAYERTFGAKKPPREMSDPATCEHRNKQLIGGALDGSWDKFICADCGTSFKVSGHRCGVNGFNQMLGDVCPACSSGAGA